MGCMNLSFGTGKARPEDEAIPVIHAHDIGITLFDTAEAYGPYVNEMLVGRAVKPFRYEIKLSTRFGMISETGLNSKPDHIRKVLDESLKRLDTDYIDLLYQHRVDPEVPIEDVASTIKELMDQGKVLNWGLSEAGPETIRRAHAALPVSAVQNQFSLWDRQSEKSVIPLVRGARHRLCALGPLGTDFLTGTIDTNASFDPETDLRASFPRFTRENMQANMPLVDMLRDIAKRKNASVTQIALALILSRKDFIVPIPGMDKIEYVDDNVKSVDLVLDRDDLAEIEERLAQIEIHGDRLSRVLLDDIHESFE